MSRTPNADLATRILREAIDIVSREGADRITMRSLAEKLGYSVATIYIYFRNKDELLNKIALYGFDRLANALEPAMRIEDAREAVVDAGRRYVQFGIAQPALYRLMFQDIAPQFEPAERAHALRSWEMCRELYERAIEQGRFRPCNAVLEASIGWAWSHGYVQLVNAGRLPIRDVGDSPDLPSLCETMLEERLRLLCP